MLKLAIKILSSITTVQKRKNERVIEYIDKCICHFNIVLYHEKHDNREVDYAHKWLKHMHNDIYNHVGNVISAKECDIIKKSLMSARIYHRANQYGCITDDDIKNDYHERFMNYAYHPYNSEEMRQNSNEYILSNLVRNGEVLDKSTRDSKLQAIKTVCLEDIMRIEALREKAKSRLVFVIG